MKTLLLVALVWNGHLKHHETYILDRNLTGPECIALLSSPPTTFTQYNGETVDLQQAQIDCRLDTVED